MAEKNVTPPPQDHAAPPPPWVVDLLRALKPQGPLEQAGLTPEHIARIKEAPAPQRYRDIPWRSEETGATGVAHVVESKKFPNGRIVSIAGYTHPPEAYIHESDGGRVPDGFGMWEGHQRSVPEGQEPQLGDLNPAFRQWRYETFYRADLRFYIGREIKVHHCQDELGLKTAWSESKVGAVSEA
jgi:hypothetical protein